MTDFITGEITPGDIGYDIETYPNIFTLRAFQPSTGQKWYFEISDWRNDHRTLCNWLNHLRPPFVRQNDVKLVGFNSLGFDYPVIHLIHQSQPIGITAAQIYDKAMSIINAQGNARFSHMVWESDHIVPQVDLYKVHHFDNVSKATSLKVLEFNLRMRSVEDLPFPVGTVLTRDQVPILKSYNDHDVEATMLFHEHSQSALKLREDLSRRIGKNLTNCSDVKLGEHILIHEMEQAGISCFEYVDGRKRKRQTQRDFIRIEDVIFPYVSFERPEFNHILSTLKSKTITETKGVFKDMVASVDGLDYTFGTGGLHASVEAQIVKSSETHQLVDVDVASYYPNMGIKNRIYPAHLGEAFCDAYEGVYKTRKTFPKKTPENEAYKLALNGAYGGSNNEYSPFYDPQYAMTITINGQLLLCMLVDQLVKVPGLRMIQANTDGVTYLCPREYLDHTRKLCRWWESVTNLELEEALYSRMFIRDVNSYIAEYEDGSLKRIGCYAYETALENPGTRELPWHKDWSQRVVARAAEAALVHGHDIRQFIESHADVYDFMLRTKVPRSSVLEWGGRSVDNVVRYFVATKGKPLEKVMPPAGPLGAWKRANGLTDAFYNEVLAEVGSEWDERIHTKNKSKYEERRTAICAGWPVQLANNLDNVNMEDFFDDINIDYYVSETEKIVKPLVN